MGVRPPAIAYATLYENDSPEKRTCAGKPLTAIAGTSAVTPTPKPAMTYSAGEYPPANAPA